MMEIRLNSNLLPYLLFLIIPLTHVHTNDLPYSIQPLDNQAGLFYHDLGFAKISHDYYTLLSYTNISFYHHTLDSIKRLFDTSLVMCSKVSDALACKDTMKLCKSQILMIESKFDTIAHLVGRKSTISTDQHNRKRRGIFNGVSYVFNWLFGTPDASDAKYYSESIKNLIEKNHDVQMLMKQQIHVISSAIKNYNESAQTLRLNEDKLNANIKKFNIFSKSTANHLESLSRTQIITEYLMLLSQMIQELNEEYDTLISAILFSKQNTLHPSIITPKDLRNELMQIKLASDCQFPIPLNDYNNIYKYFSISELSVIYDHELLIVAIKIPLVHERTYNLYKIIPLPAQHYNSSIYSFINPSYPYLLLSTTKTHYSRLRDISSCKKITEEDYICYNPSTYLSAERPVCEVTLKTRISDSIPEDCPTHTIKANFEIWHPLSSNSWLFVTTHRTAASITCENKKSDKILDIVLSGTGIFKMNSKCKCYTYSTVLTATSNDTRIYNNYIPNFSIISDECCIKKHKFLSHQANQMEPIEINNLNLDELRHSQHKLEQFDEILQKSINEPFFNYETPWFLIITSIAVIIAIIMICCCCNCSWLPYIGKIFPKRIGCCGTLPNICITNHNERYQINEEHAIRLNRLRRIYQDEEQQPTLGSPSGELVPMCSETVEYSGASLDSASAVKSFNGVETRSRKSGDRRFYI